MENKMRGSGVLLSITSLPSKYGIGCFSKEAYEFVDQLKEAGQKFWQILPLGPTGYGDSPYQPFSTFAGNPYFIDLETLIEEGYLTRAECEECDFGSEEQSIDYGRIYSSRFKVLRVAYERWKKKKKEGNQEKEFLEFCKKNEYWLEEYATYMTIKDNMDGASHRDWEKEIRMHKGEAIHSYKAAHEKEMVFFKVIQFFFFKQWIKLKAYANQNGIRIIGDVPIYVAYDSVDVWSNPKLFQLDENHIPTAVSGCPPDAFTPTGQLWGNPLYDWEYHKKTGYAWWCQRMKHSLQLYDVVRLDHFRGFDEYYAVPYGEPTAENGKWEKGPGMNIFNQLKKELGTVDIIAEDLGFLTKSVIQLVEETGFPGMKILQFAFNSRVESEYLPHHYNKNCVVYTGTHDNDTLLSWFDIIKEEDRKFAMEYVNIHDIDLHEVNWEFIRLAMSCVANTCIIPIQDYLGLGKEARLNMPSTLGKNWTWRMRRGEFTKEIRNRMKKLTKMYGR